MVRAEQALGTLTQPVLRLGGNASGEDGDNSAPQQLGCQEYHDVNFAANEQRPSKRRTAFAVLLSDGQKGDREEVCTNDARRAQGPGYEGIEGSGEGPHEEGG